MPSAASFSLLPERLLDLDFNSQQVRPRYLTPRSRQWIQELVDRVVACEGRTREEVKEALAIPPHMGERWTAWRAMGHLLTRASGFKVDAAVPPRSLRADLFPRAAVAPPGAARGMLLQQTAAAFGLTSREVEACLYADLPQRRVLKKLEDLPPLDQLLEQYNLCQVQGLMMRCERLEITLDGNARAVLRTARLRQLLCLATRRRDGRVHLELTGPISLFHKTRKYGFAMASWLPALFHAPRWSLVAEVSLREGTFAFEACQDDPLGANRPLPRRFDSRLEERFFRDLRKLHSPWEVLREADTVQVGPHLAFPDFTLVDPARGLRVPVEIIGFWTPEYLHRKQAIITSLPRQQRWCLLLDKSLAAAEDWDLSTNDDDVFLFNRRIDASAFLVFLESWIRKGQGAGSGVPATQHPGPSSR